MEEKRKHALQLLYQFLNTYTVISAEKFIYEMSKIPLYYTKRLSNLQNWLEVFNKEYYNQLKDYIHNTYQHKIINNKMKINIYKQINSIITDFLEKYKISNDQLVNYVQQELIYCISINDLFINNTNKWYQLVNNINIIGLDKIINNLIKEDFKKREEFYCLKAKGWINKFYEQYLLNQEEKNYNPIIHSLKELQNINKIGEEFNIDKEVIYEIDNSLKDKFTWIPGKFVTSDDDYGLHHSQQYSNIIEERRNKQINKNRMDFISNARQPEDLNIELTEEEKKIPAAFGSYYFNKTVAIIEGKHLITRGDNNYNTLIKILKGKFKHVFDLSIQNKSMKQESTLKLNKSTFKVSRLMTKI